MSAGCLATGEDHSDVADGFCITVLAFCVADDRCAVGVGEEGGDRLAIGSAACLLTKNGYQLARAACKNRRQFGLIAVAGFLQN